MLIDIDLLEASDRIARLSDSMTLTEGEAAVFLRLSPRTMQRMRGPEYHGKGPPFIQADGMKGPNQKVSYKLGDIKAWQRGNTLTSTIEAAVRKGQLFATIHDAFDEPAPFWMNERGLLGRVFDSSPEVFFDRIGVVEIVWILQFDAVTEVWADTAAHIALANKAKDLLGHARGQIDAAVEKSELLAN